MEDGAGRLTDWELVGRGASGIVYRARMAGSGRTVAVKILAMAEPDDMARGRFRREVLAMDAVRHDGVVRVEGMEEIGGKLALVSEFVEGAPLQHLLGDLAPPLALAVLAQLGGPLDAIHAAGVVHRDLKPANILVDLTGRCRVVDFGVARFVGESRHAPGRNLVQTRTGAVIGTPAYLSPEVIGGQPVDGRADVYSLAVLAYQLLVGRLPFQGGVYELLDAHATKPPPPPGQLVPGFPQPVSRVLEGALSKSPADRPATAGELVGALLGAAGGHWPIAPFSELAALVARHRTSFPPQAGHGGTRVEGETVQEGAAELASTQSPFPHLLPQVPPAETVSVTLRRGRRGRTALLVALVALAAALAGAAVVLLAGK